MEEPREVTFTGASFVPIKSLQAAIESGAAKVVERKKAHVRGILSENPHPLVPYVPPPSDAEPVDVLKKIEELRKQSEPPSP